MTDAQKLTDVKTVLGISVTTYDSLLNIYIRQAKQQILTYCNRSNVPEALDDVHIQLAIVYYNRRGLEGEASRTEGAITQTFDKDIPAYLMSQLNYYRVAKVPH